METHCGTKHKDTARKALFRNREGEYCFICVYPSSSVVPMKILFVRTGGLGDCILTLPVVFRLREIHPDAEIHVLGNEAMIAVARLTGLFQGFRSVDEAGFSALFSGGGTTPFLRSFLSTFDLAYCVTSAEPESFRNSVRASGVRSCRVLDPRPPREWNRHIAEYFLSILTENASPPVSLPPVAHVQSVLRRADLLVIHPGSGGLAKTWPLGRFVAVAETWPGETAFLLGPAERDRRNAGNIPERFRVIVDPALSNAAALLASAAAYLGNDSGPSHLAALCGTPSVVLFGPADPRIWRPLGGKVRTILSPNGTMEGIDTGEVMKAVHDIGENA